VKPASGAAWTFGDDVNTDVIHPPQFFSLDPAVVKRGLFHGLAPDMHERIRGGDILVAGRNFGCGSSRETSVQCLKLNGVAAIVAVDFARIFFRSATNNGLPCLTFAHAPDRARIVAGQRIEISYADSTLATDTGDRIALAPVGAFVRRIWEAGGLLEVADLFAGSGEPAGGRR
jgi:3-isopropylmalate dehydratase small subunit